MRQSSNRCHQRGQKDSPHASAESAAERFCDQKVDSERQMGTMPFKRAKGQHGGCAVGKRMGKILRVKLSVTQVGIIVSDTL